MLASLASVHGVPLPPPENQCRLAKSPSPRLRSRQRETYMQSLTLDVRSRRVHSGWPGACTVRQGRRRGLQSLMQKRRAQQQSESCYWMQDELYMQISLLNTVPCINILLNGKTRIAHLWLVGVGCLEFPSETFHLSNTSSKSSALFDWVLLSV
jgi:hypothetical protein